LGRTQPGLDECAHLLLGQRRPRPWHDERTDPLPPFLARQAGHGDLGDPLDLQDDLLDLGRRDVLAAADNRVVRPSAHEEVAAGVEIALVPGGEPAVAVGYRARLAVLARHLGTAYVNLASLTRSAGGAVG